MQDMPTILGWCPGALRPMESGDGLVVRVRPRLAQVSRRQALALCDLADTHGIGLLDLTNRANLQIRGVQAKGLEALQHSLSELGLLDDTLGEEQRRNLLLAPDWTSGDETDRIARGLLASLHELPELPAKVGFAIDAGSAPILGDDSADFRLEGGTSSRLILRADGRKLGTPVDSVEAAVTALIRLAHWFADSGGIAARRMRHHQAPLPAWAAETEAPQPSRPTLQPGEHYAGSLVVGLPFGQIETTSFRQVLAASPATGLRLTPWRCLLLEGIDSLPDRPERGIPALLTEPDAPLLRVQACAGAPQCAQSTVATRALAARLAPRVQGTLHVSGCAKGCASPRAADICLTGQNGHYDLAFQARAGDPSRRSALTEAEVMQFLGDA